MSIEELQKEVARLREENRLLQFAKTRAEEKLKDLLRRFFGPKSEKMDPAQLRLALESIQADEVLVEEEPPAPQVVPSAPRKHHGGGRRPVPENLPVVRVNARRDLTHFRPSKIDPPRVNYRRGDLVFVVGGAPFGLGSRATAPGKRPAWRFSRMR